MKTSRGLTVLELLVAMTVASVLLFYAIPAFNDFTDQRRIASGANSIVAGVNYARSEAARLGTDVTLQAMGADDANEWGEGFCVTQNDPGDCDDPLNVFEADDVLSMNAVDGLQGLDGLTFNSRGMLVGVANGQINVCGADAASNPGREVRINATGRASVGEFTCPDP